ncbi:MAG TPA: Calx-beta domain-containing protein, partial [Vicinamibacterales bacterium]|nr:Calx-beta domain-containing protein [Vicinamibacterales bacterium]
KTVVVIASGMSFSPSTVNIDVGDSVTFQNNGGFHNVAADGGSFRCANGCDDTAGNGAPSSNSWSFTRTFSQAGSIPFHCEVHGFPGGGMHGTIVVTGASQQNGTLQFSAAAYSVSEGTAQAQITVTRTNGDDGAVSLHYATNAQTATAGSDFTNASGTLSWAAGDDASKSFSVPIANDTAVESNETVQLVLSAPDGGASLGAATAVLTIVDDDAPSGPHGKLQFSSATYSVTEGTAQAQIAVTRTNGDDGAVSVHYATHALSATAGSDFTSASGTLSWGAGDHANKTFSVAIANDTAVEPNETVQLVLSAPGGGAALGTATAVLTIADNDSPSGTGPAAPAKLHATATSLGGVVLAWQDKSSNETTFRVQGRRLDESGFSDRGTTSVNTTELAVDGLPSGTAFVFRVRAENAGGNSAFSEEIIATTDTTPAPCVSDFRTLCLSGGRFSATIDWRTESGPGQAGEVPLPANPDSGLFFFFAPENIEALVKIVNACSFTTPRFWVFMAATTNVEFTVQVTDVTTGKMRTYFNPLGRAAPPVQDTDAFATCP